MPAPRCAARVTGPSSRRLLQRQLLPSGQMDSTAWTWARAAGDPARGRKPPFIAGTPALRLTPTRSAAQRRTRTPGRRCPWRRCPRSCCCCCCCPRPVSRAGPRAGARHPHGSSPAGKRPRPAAPPRARLDALPCPDGAWQPGGLVGRGVEKGALGESLRASAGLPTPDSSPCDRWQRSGTAGWDWPAGSPDVPLPAAAGAAPAPGRCSDRTCTRQRGWRGAHCFCTIHQ